MIPRAAAAVRKRRQQVLRLQQRLQAVKQPERQFRLRSVQQHLQQVWPTKQKAEEQLRGKNEHEDDEDEKFKK